MQKPKMILFDYGQTLLNEAGFDGIAGTKAVLSHAKHNPEHKTAEQIQAFANELNADIGRYQPDTRKKYMIEVHNHYFQKYLYESLHIDFDLPQPELETLFWDSAAPGVKTEHIDELFHCLAAMNIRTGVISNISYSGEALKKRIETHFPQNNFEFIIASSDYVFRKPHRRIFELALHKAELAPEEVWFCGDNVFCDIEGASQSGLLPVWYMGASVFSQENPTCECLQIDDWNKLISILKELKAAETEVAAANLK